ncbi:hypothetical protein [Yoonia algicola]|uniref:Uncharacterized protein n=1 Tax=Yoonia algicola TaxID=3137368 RepID=A0AAN0M4U2_9RHOB
MVGFEITAFRSEMYHVLGTNFSSQGASGTVIGLARFGVVAFGACVCTSDLGATGVAAAAGAGFGVLAFSVLLGFGAAFFDTSFAFSTFAGTGIGVAFA